MDTKLKTTNKQENKGIKAKINAWLEHMAEINKKEFGDGKMPCCSGNTACHAANK